MKKSFRGKWIRDSIKFRCFYMFLDIESRFIENIYIEKDIRLVYIFLSRL